MVGILLLTLTRLGSAWKFGIIFASLNKPFLVEALLQTQSRLVPLKRAFELTAPGSRSGTHTEAQVDNHFLSLECKTFLGMQNILQEENISISSS